MWAGHYCLEGSETAVPCPRGMFTPSFWAKHINDCISCPPHHYAPIEGLSACLPCGSRAQQPLPGQEKCACQVDGQVFQASDGQCHCALGYQSTQKGDACELKIYEICKDGKTRDQYGRCLDHRQWKHLCSYEVCASPELYEGFDASLGLCVCKSLPDSGRKGGFYGFLHTIPAGVRMSILEGDQVKDSLSEISDRHSMGKVLLKGS
ncbi:uncharacterized protein LOC128532810 [Clarias gariepinus]|uniref:uncharacterized protein LOC128532810 n=1 Tax=Clarias gariepinus TaxID=13013 RepID=UPI00234D6A96|nr:uncharacterized protein LOC128532810 [Clarias gariepinus]